MKETDYSMFYLLGAASSAIVAALLAFAGAERDAIDLILLSLICLAEFKAEGLSALVRSHMRLTDAMQEKMKLMVEIITENPERGE